MLTTGRSILLSGSIVASAVLGASALLQQRYSFDVVINNGMVSVIRGDVNSGHVCVFPAGSYMHVQEQSASEPSYFNYMTEEERGAVRRDAPPAMPMVANRKEELRWQAARMLPRSQAGSALPTCY